MLIRSQDKSRLINLDNTRELRFWECAQGFNITDCVCPIGHYSTKEKVMRVLDMIQEAYADFEATKCISTGLLAIPYSKRFVCEEEQEKAHTAIRECADMLKKAHIFQMPQDGSVEV